MRSLNIVSKAPKAVFPWWVCLIALIIILVVMGAAHGAINAVDSFVITATSVCRPVSMDREIVLGFLPGNQYFTLDCAGQKSAIYGNDEAVMAHLLNKEKQLRCTLYKSGWATCEVAEENK